VQQCTALANVLYSEVKQREQKIQPAYVNFLLQNGDDSYRREGVYFHQICSCYDLDWTSKQDEQTDGRTTSFVIRPPREKAIGLQQLDHWLI